MPPARNWMEYSHLIQRFLLFSFVATEISKRYLSCIEIPGGMAIYVPPGQHKVSSSEDLMSRTSQCVAMGVSVPTKDLTGIAHIHFRNDHERILDSLIEELMMHGTQPPEYRIKVMGGVDAFVPGYGFVPGRANADRVIGRLTKIGLESAIIETDIYEDYTREMIARALLRCVEIWRI